MRIKFLLLLFTIGAAVSCSKDNEEEQQPTPCNTDPASIHYASTITGILSTNGCYGCHSGSAASGGGNILDNYAGVKIMADNGKLVGAINHASGFSPMPKGGTKMSDCDIAKIEAWVDAGALND